MEIPLGQHPETVVIPVTTRNPESCNVCSNGSSLVYHVGPCPYVFTYKKGQYCKRCGEWNDH